MVLKSHVICFFAMVTEEQKYRAYTLNIFGFIFLTPAGKLFLEFREYLSDLGQLGFVTYLGVCLGLVIIGLGIIEFGRATLDIKRRTK